jgi:lipoprotein-releasing system permease protein
VLPFKIAVRFLTYGKTQTILIALGMAVAISIQIFVGLLIDSLQKSLVERTIGRSPQITISSGTDVPTIRNWESIIARINQLGVTGVTTASASGNGIITKNKKEIPVLVRGFQFDEATKIYKFNTAIYQGRPYRGSQEVIIGKELSQELESGIGDRIQMTTPGGTTTTFTISGLYDLGVAGINKSWIITNLSTAQQIFDYSGRVTTIEMRVDDVFSAGTTAALIKNTLNNQDLKIEDWQKLNAELLSGLQGQSSSSNIIQVVIVISVIIAIGSVLVISVLQKSRQIGILKAMGIKDSAASLIFIYQGFMLGFVGSILGILLGVGLLLAFNIFTTKPDGSTLVTIYVDYGFLVRSWLIALFASTIAALLPANKSLRLNPIDVIREG